MFNPKFNISNEILLLLAEIERLTVHLHQAVIPPEVLAHIKKQCLVSLTHFSTQIEGNKLSIEQVSGVLERHKTFGLMRDEKEVKNYFHLLEQMTALIKKYGKNISHSLILQCHSRILNGIVETKLTGKFREVQNAIYESASGALVYLPPEVKDVVTLMNDLVGWVFESKWIPIAWVQFFTTSLLLFIPFWMAMGVPRDF